MQSVDTSHTITYLKHGSYFVQRHSCVYAFQLLTKDIGNLAYLYIIRQHILTVLLYNPSILINKLLFDFL